ncbi:helicase [Candidatus Planktophila dulcis]|uniref:helicase-associated domain-containing protein n=1 Tax=Candidatus Planktophila dulcis TaxID=1884914 RepID=UPI000BACA0B8|nr:helicase-associated domain-containing protein [Candidatus Planktophila dulcis]ASY15070.1 helicase [Candidatus Planktophila dulcis]
MEIRSYADYLRALDDAALISMFNHRPDLVTPVPPDMASLAVRASSAPSLARAVDALNKWQLQVLEVCAILPEPFSEKDVTALTEKSALFVIPGLIERGLLYTDKDGLRTPTTLKEVLGNEIAGLGPASMSKLKLKKLDEVPAPSKKVLDAMVWGPPRGAIADIKKPSVGVQWLLEEGFLIPFNQQTVVLPREVAIYLRGNTVHRELETSQPSVTGSKRDMRNVQLAAIANITTFLRWTEEVLNFWAQEPATALRSGGLGVRDLKELSLHLGVDESCTAFVAEVAYLSGLLTIDPDDKILPTHQFDIWLTQNASVKWQLLASAWLSTSRVSGLVGKEGSKNVAPLGPELDRSSATTTRRLTLTLLQENSQIAVDIDSLFAAATWLAPAKRAGGLQKDYILWAMREAEWLGITGQGVLSSYGADFLTGGDSTSVDTDLPKAVDHILIQSDNTAIAPGPLEHEVAQELALIADVESRGGATVFRFSEGSIRRGLDHGRTGEEIAKFLAKTSKTPMPQPLEYLIADVAKKHGKLRVGNTASFIRCEDSALITQILGDKRLDVLGLRKIAPEVLICGHDATEAMNILRSCGYLPAAEDSRGLLLSGPRIQRAQTKARPPRIIGEYERPDEIQIEGALRALRTGEKSSRKQSTMRNIATEALGSLPRSTANETLELLSDYLQNQPTKSLSIGYADNNGLVSHRIIDPLKLSAGSLVARDHATGEVQTFRIARITGVAAL